MLQRASRGEPQQFREIEDEDRRHGFMNGENGVGDGLISKVGLDVPPFQVGAPAPLEF